MELEVGTRLKPIKKVINVNNPGLVIIIDIKDDIFTVKEKTDTNTILTNSSNIEINVSNDNYNVIDQCFKIMHINNNTSDISVYSLICECFRKYVANMFSGRMSALHACLYSDKSLFNDTNDWVYRFFISNVSKCNDDIIISFIIDNIHRPSRNMGDKILISNSPYECGIMECQIYKDDTIQITNFKMDDDFSHDMVTTFGSFSEPSRPKEEQILSYLKNFCKATKDLR